MFSVIRLSILSLKLVGKLSIVLLIASLDTELKRLAYYTDFVLNGLTIILSCFIL